MLKKYKIDFIAFFLMISLSACSFHAKKLDKITNLQDERVKENTTAARVANQVTKAQISQAQGFLATSNYFNTKLSLGVAADSSDLTEGFLRRNQNLIGLPIQPQEEIVKSLLSTNKVEQTAAVKIQDQKETQEIKWNAEKSKREQELLTLGAQYEEIKNKSIVKRFFGWLTGLIGISGIVLLCIFCPAVIPIFFRLVGAVVNKVPVLVNWFGITGKKYADSLVKGVGSIRNDLKTAKEQGKQYSADEVLKIIDTNLKIALDSDHKAIVDRQRKDLNI